MQPWMRPRAWRGSRIAPYPSLWEGWKWICALRLRPRRLSSGKRTSLGQIARPAPRRCHAHGEFSINPASSYRNGWGPRRVFSMSSETFSLNVSRSRRSSACLYSNDPVFASRTGARLAARHWVHDQRRCQARRHRSRRLATLAAPRPRQPRARSQSDARRGAIHAWRRQRGDDERLFARAAKHLERPQAGRGDFSLSFWRLQADAELV